METFAFFTTRDRCKWPIAVVTVSCSKLQVVTVKSRYLTRRRTVSDSSSKPRAYFTANWLFIGLDSIDFSFVAKLMHKKWPLQVSKKWPLACNFSANILWTALELTVLTNNHEPYSRYTSSLGPECLIDPRKVLFNTHLICRNQLFNLEGGLGAILLFIRLFD